MLSCIQGTSGADPGGGGQAEGKGSSKKGA